MKKSLLIQSLLAVAYAAVVKPKQEEQATMNTNKDIQEQAQAALSDEHIEALRSIAQSWMSEAGRDSIEDWIATILATRQPAPVASTPAVAVPRMHWKDALRRSGADPDYHGVIAFTAKQLQDFVRMVQGDELPAAASVAADVALLKDARHRIANLSRTAVPFDDPLDGPVLRRLDAAIAAQPPADAAQAGAEPFGIYVERDDGTSEFQRTGKAFNGTAHGYKAWTLYTAQPSTAQGDALSQEAGGWPVGYSVNRVEGHGWYIDPPKGGRWVAHDGTPAADFIAALAQRAASKDSERDARPAELIPKIYGNEIIRIGKNDNYRNSVFIGCHLILDFELRKDTSAQEEVWGTGPVQVVFSGVPELTDEAKAVFGEVLTMTLCVITGPAELAKYGGQRGNDAAMAAQQGEKGGGNG